MKTFLTAILFISIVFSVFILNKDFSVKSVKDNVVLDEAETSLVQQGAVGSTSQTYAKEEPAKPRELELEFKFLDKFPLAGSTIVNAPGQ